MSSLFSIDYTEKTLQLAIRNFGEDKGRGLVYNPRQIYSKLNELSEHFYEEFFQPGDFSIVSIRTRQGPGELAKILEREFGVESNFGIGGILAQINSTYEQAKKILDDLIANPKKYYESEEEKLFFGKPKKISPIRKLLK